MTIFVTLGEVILIIAVFFLGALWGIQKFLKGLGKLFNPSNVNFKGDKRGKDS